jgi:hypothetical protein
MNRAATTQPVVAQTDSVSAIRNTTSPSKAANLIIAQTEAPLAQLLQFQPCLHLVYEDQLAAVFVARKDQVAQSGTVASGFCASRDKLSTRATE